MKKQYIKPDFFVVKLYAEDQILTSSFTINNGGEEITDGTEILSNSWSSENWISTEDEE